MWLGFHTEGSGNRPEASEGNDACTLPSWSCEDEYVSEESTHDYDAAGNLIRTDLERYQHFAWPDPTEMVDRAMSRKFYGADQKLRYVQQHRRRADLDDPPNGELYWDGEFIEYRYDALGRRVFARTRRDDSGLCQGSSPPCDGHIDRFVWDGEQLIMEQRASAAWRYVHGLGIDRPLSQLGATGTNVTFAHVDWRGLTFTATDANGDEFCSGGGAPCPTIDWPGLNRRTHLRRDSFVRIDYAWYGTLITGGADASDLLYRRNRYYDPESGAFTQADPIGIAGGVNLYGYAGGDPINFWDPFGLCAQRGSRIFDPDDEDGDDCDPSLWERPSDTQCLAAGALAVANVAADVTTLLGVGAVVRAGALAYGTGRVATTVARESTVRQMTPSIIQQSQAFTSEALRAGAGTGAGHLAASAGTATASSVQQASVSVLDFVPGFASFKSVNRARDAC